MSGMSTSHAVMCLTCAIRAEILPRVLWLGRTRASPTLTGGLVLVAMVYRMTVRRSYINFALWDTGMNYICTCLYTSRAHATHKLHGQYITHPYSLHRTAITRTPTVHIDGQPICAGQEWTATTQEGARHGPPSSRNVGPRELGLPQQRYRTRGATQQRKSTCNSGDSGTAPDA